jgi:hypothetical protein
LPAWAGPLLRSLPLAVDEVPERGPRGRFAGLSFGADLLSISEMRGQLESATSLRCVAPLLDPTIVEFVASLRPKLLLHGDRVRGLLRLAAAGGVDALGDITKVRALSDLGIVEPQAFQERLARRPAYEEDIWPALACEAFLLDQKRRGARVPS